MAQWTLRACRVNAGFTLRQVAKKVNKNFQTISKWEKAGLRRYQPPLEDTRKIYYKISDIWKFLGVENGKV